MGAGVAVTGGVEGTEGAACGGVATGAEGAPGVVGAGLLGSIAVSNGFSLGPTTGVAGMLGAVGSILICQCFLSVY